MNELVEKLTKKGQELAAERSGSATELKEQIDRGFVLLKFTGTRGGTELGSQLDLDRCDLSNADFDGSTGSVQLVGNLVLNYDRVELNAEIDLETLKGTGHLVLIEDEATILRNKQEQAGMEAEVAATTH